MTIKIRIIIADDHPIFRAGLKQMIESDESFEVIFEAEDGAAALRATEKLKPDVLVLDVDMPKMTGLQVAAEIQKRSNPVSIVLLTIHNDEAMLTKAINLGVKCYVLKDSAANEILSCLRAVTNGQNFTSPAMTTHLFNRANRAETVASIETLIDLNDTERKILKMIAEYKTSREIGDALYLSYRTIENYRTNICGKLNLKGAHSLIKFALKHQHEL